ncbi:MAG: GNAT family N-acetyltransferase [Elusimicrobiales bacterium]|jgi:RimJ/RimL family protein N-acetyltransferase
MAIKKIEQVIKNEGLPEITIRLAKVADMRRIQVLYTEVYGGNYSISLITDKDKMRRAIENDSYYWLVAESGGRIIGSLVYALDIADRISKAFGAVVSKDYRKLNLAHTMMKLVLDDITQTQKLAEVVYATTRTASHAPQKLTESLGFIKLGIFPNTHKVSENETHCLTAYFTEEALKKREPKPNLVKEIVPFYDLVRRQLNLDEPVVTEVKSLYQENRQMIPPLPLETITASAFIKNRFKNLKSNSFFEHSYMPFHEPNLLFIAPDQSTEVYLNYSQKDKYSVVMGGVTREKSSTVVLESIARKLNEMNMSYIEILLDAYTPQLQREALDARYIPSGYFPCIKRSANKRYDCIVFSRTFEVLDFRNVKLLSLYKNFLREYLSLWREHYIESAFRND